MPTLHPITVTVDVLNLDMTKEMFSSVHDMLVARLLHGQDSREFLEAINRVIDAHDAIADRISEDADR